MALLGATDGSETALHQRGAATVVRAGSAVNGMKWATKMMVFIWFYMLFFKYIVSYMVFMWFYWRFHWAELGFNWIAGNIGDVIGYIWDFRDRIGILLEYIMGYGLMA